MFAAVIAHADDAPLLTRCIGHHLSVGFDRVFVSLNTPDQRQDDMHRARWAHDPRVRIETLDSLSPDPFHYFTFAKNVVMEWAAPEWVAFIDSDEFWLPRTGRMADTAGLASAELLNVRRCRAAIVSDVDRSFPPTPFSDLYLAPLHPDSDLSKILVRPELVVEVGRGAHSCTATRPLREGPRPTDLVIAHLSFTTLARFNRKITKVRLRMEEYGHRFAPEDATHWRAWLEVNSAELAAEFQSLVMSPGDVEGALSRGELTTAHRLLTS